MKLLVYNIKKIVTLATIFFLTIVISQQYSQLLASIEINNSTLVELDEPINRENVAFSTKELSVCGVINYECIVTSDNLQTFYISDEEMSDLNRYLLLSGSTTLSKVENNVVLNKKELLSTVLLMIVLIILSFNMFESSLVQRYNSILYNKINSSKTYLLYLDYQKVPLLFFFLIIVVIYRFDLSKIFYIYIVVYIIVSLNMFSKVSLVKKGNNFLSHYLDLIIIFILIFILSFGIIIFSNTTYGLYDNLKNYRFNKEEYNTMYSIGESALNTLKKVEYDEGNLKSGYIYEDENKLQEFYKNNYELFYFEYFDNIAYVSPNIYSYAGNPLEEESVYYDPTIYNVNEIEKLVKDIGIEPKEWNITPYNTGQLFNYTSGTTFTESDIIVSSESLYFSDYNNTYYQTGTSNNGGRDPYCIYYNIKCERKDVKITQEYYQNFRSNFVMFVYIVTIIGIVMSVQIIYYNKIISKMFEKEKYKIVTDFVYLNDTSFYKGLKIYIVMLFILNYIITLILNTYYFYSSNLINIFILVLFLSFLIKMIKIVKVNTSEKILLELKGKYD